MLGKTNKTRQGSAPRSILKLAGYFFAGLVGYRIGAKAASTGPRYNKPALSIPQQIRQLQQRGMEIPDAARAAHYLTHINYYRLTAYWLPFEADHATHTFRTGVSFEDVLNLYTFDRELRLLVLDAIERVEISIRTQWAYYLAHEHGPHGYLDPTLYGKKFMKENLRQLKKEVRRSRETFIRHYVNTYDDPELPPTWSICEVMSLGNLSRWYGSLKPVRTRRLIAKQYRLDDQVLSSFLQHLSYVRNVCAHHSRLWNRQFTIKMALPKRKPAELMGNFNQAEPAKVYNTFVMLLWILDDISPNHTWKQRLLELIEKHNISTASMGFPDDFKMLSIWQ